MVGDGFKAVTVRTLKAAVKSIRMMVTRALGGRLTERDAVVSVEV